MPSTPGTRVAQNLCVALPVEEDVDAGGVGMLGRVQSELEHAGALLRCVREHLDDLDRAVLVAARAKRVVARPGPKPAVAA